jgi:restriction system protein
VSGNRSGELLLGVFEILRNSRDDGLPAKEVLRQLEKVVPPNAFEEGTYPNRPNVRRYEKIVRFATIGPVKAGWLVKDKGTWSLTDAGRAAFENLRDPEAFIREASRLYRVWKADQPTDRIDSVDDLEEDANDAVATLEEAEEAAWSEIESYLERMSPYDFQELVAGLLRGMGYHVDWVSPPGPDKGIDIVAHTDPLGVKGPRIKARRLSDAQTRQRWTLFVVSWPYLGSRMWVFSSALADSREKRRTKLAGRRREE